MRFRAIAVASAKSNAVGTVELECTTEALAVSYLGVGSFSDGYAPGPSSERRQFDVPWPSIEQATVEGDELYLAFDPKLGPLNRLLLSGFSTGSATHHHALYQRRLLVRVGSAGAALVAALLAGGAAQRLAPETTFRVAFALAFLSAAIVIGTGFLADRWIQSGGLEGSAAREALFAELARHLPRLTHSASRAPRLEKLVPSLFERFQGLLPRTTAAVVMSLVGAGLAAVLTARGLLSRDPSAELARGLPRAAARPAPLYAATPEPPAAAPAARARPAAPSPTQGTKAASAAESGRGESCSCRRSDSLLWSTPFPRLSVITLSHRVRPGRGEDERRDKRYSELEVAVVNNSNEPLKDVALLVQFFDHDPPPSNKRYVVSNRPLYFEGPLTPGQAIKWSVEAEGVDYEITSAITGDVGAEGELAAPTNLIADLLHAHNRPVRLHGAMLLAFFGDPRAREAILDLREALREDEEPYLDRLLRAVSDTRVCALAVSDAGDARRVHACVFNAGKQPQKDLGVRLRALDRSELSEHPSGPPPAVLAEGTARVPGELAPGTGVRIDATLELDGTHPFAFEAFADRIDLLPR